MRDRVYYRPPETNPIDRHSVGQFQMKAGRHLMPRSHSVSIDFPGLSLLPTDLN